MPSTCLTCPRFTIPERSHQPGFCPAVDAGNPLGAIGVMAYMNPRRHIYSAVSRENGVTLAGGIIHTNGDTFAKLLYLAPASEMERPALPALIENLAAQAGTWGAMHVLAEIDEISPAFVPLRQAGFSVYAWQRIWDVTPLELPAAMAHDGHAQAADGQIRDGIACELGPSARGAEPVPPDRSAAVAAGGTRARARPDIFATRASGRTWASTRAWWASCCSR